MYAYKNSDNTYTYASRSELQEAIPELPQGFLTPDVLDQFGILSYRMTIPGPGLDAAQSIENPLTHWLREISPGVWEIYKRETPLPGWPQYPLNENN